MLKLIFNLLSIFIPQAQRRNFRHKLKHLTSLIPGMYLISGSHNQIFLVSSKGEKRLRFGRIKGLKIILRGTNNLIKIGFPCIFENSIIKCTGNNCQIDIGRNGKIRNTLIKCCDGQNQHCHIGEEASIWGLELVIRNETSCWIGNRALFSKNITIWTADGHTIIDKASNKIINNQKYEVMIGDDCWICQNSQFTKNASIPNQTIVAMGSVVSRKFKEENTIIAGNPAKVVKTGIEHLR